MATFVLGGLLGSAPVMAQPTAQDRGLAEGLFVQAKQLMSAGKYAEACLKLMESQRLDPGGGTMMNLALCHEQEGKIATAWADFKEALALARRDNRPEREAVALQHIAALEARLPYLTLKVAGKDVTGLEIKLGGAPLSPTLWGEAMPLDPGSHRIEASAPGHGPWVRSIEVKEGERSTLAVPALVKGASASAPPPADGGGAGSAKGSSSTVGLVVGGVGLAALGVGGFFGVRTFSKKKESDDLCPTRTTCSPRGLALNDEAHTSAWIANVGVGVGLVGVGLGTYLLLSSGSTEESLQKSGSSLRLGAEVGQTHAGLELGGAF